jgi:hypothetical protein
MTLGFSSAVRGARVDAITTATGASAKLRFYGGTRPTTGGATTTLAAELICNATFAGSAAGGPTITISAIAPLNASANVSPVTWFRLLKADGTTIIMDGDVGTTGSDLNVSSTSFVSGQQVSVTSWTITDGNG